MLDYKAIVCELLGTATGSDDLKLIEESKIDVAYFISQGARSINDLLSMAFEDIVVETIGAEALEDLTIEPNYLATDMYINNREKYKKSDIDKIEDYMGLEFVDVDTEE